MKTNLILPLIFLASAITGAFAEKPPLTLSPDSTGVTIDGGDMGKYIFPVPNIILDPKDYSGQKPAIAVKSNVLDAHYPCGATLKMIISNEDKSISFSFNGIPKNARSFISAMQLPISLSAGGRFAFNNNAPTPFPEQKDRQILGGEGATRFTIIDPMDEGFTIVTPQNFQQLQDNRVFNWAIFVYHFFYSFQDHPTDRSFVIKFEPVEGDAAPKFLVDRFGQSARKDYPGKVTSEEELKQDAEKEKTASPPTRKAPEEDIYGGLAGSGEKYGLKKTGFFHVETAANRKVLVTPEGNIFFQLGICGIQSTDDYTLVAGREKTYEWLPSPNDPVYGSAWKPDQPGVISFFKANWIRKFGKPFNLEEWSGQVVKRMRAWGFNSAGAFSARTKAMSAAKLPYVEFLPLSENGLKMLPDKIGEGEILDPFAPGTEAVLEKAFTREIDPMANNPLLIGYFLGNEQHTEKLPELIPGYKASEIAAKGVLVKMLEKKYGQIDRFNAAWKPAKPAANFDDLKERLLVVQTEASSADMREFTRNFLDAYYSMVARVFHRHDPHHLLIGSRWTPATASNEDIVRIGGKYLDVVSVNYYTMPIKKEFLKRVYEWSGQRPILLSEWYYSTTDQGLSGGLEVKNQNERGMAYRNYVEQAAATPWVVGSEWFIYGDQSITGRFFQGFNGERANTGFVNVVDRPYPELVEAACKTNDHIYDVMSGKTAPFVFDDPRFNDSKPDKSSKARH